MWAVPPQPCSQSGKRRWFSCTTAAPCGPFGAQPSASGNLIASRQAHFSTITRLPSGSSASRSTSFRSGAFGVGDRYCPPLHGRVGGTSAHPHSASDSSFGVVLRIRAHMWPHGLGRNTSRKPCATPLHPSAQSRLSPESPAPWLMRLVRPRC